MPGIVLNVVYSKNEGLVLSPSDLINNYLIGIPLCFSDGRHLDNNTIKQKITAAQTQLENFLSIKLNKQMIEESKDFIRTEFASWGFIKTTYPVVTPQYLEGRLNEATQVHYPKEWLSVKKTNKVAVFRNVYLIPNTKGANGAVGNQNGFIYSGITPSIGWFGSDFLPNYWYMQYSTGWDKIPADLMEAIGKLAAIQILAIIGDIILGVGITSSSLSLDGLSQSLTSTKSANGGIFAGRIKSYMEQLEKDLANLKAEYKGITFMVG